MLGRWVSCATAPPASATDIKAAVAIAVVPRNAVILQTIILWPSPDIVLTGLQMRPTPSSVSPVGVDLASWTIDLLPGGRGAVNEC